MTDNREAESRESARRRPGRLGRRRAEELLDGSGSWPRPEAAEGADDVAPLARLLAAAAEPPAGSTAGSEARQEKALAAFRAAREAGDHAETVRRQDDWSRRRADAKAPKSRWPQPGRLLPGGRSARAVLGTVVAAMALCGVAVAAGTGVLSVPPGLVVPGAGAPGLPTAPTGIVTSVPSGPYSHSTPGSGGAPTADGDPREAATRGSEALCRAYERAEGAGHVPDVDTLVRLAHLAGDDETVSAYCERLGAKPSEAGNPKAGKDEAGPDGKSERDQAGETENGKPGPEDSGTPAPQNTTRGSTGNGQGPGGNGQGTGRGQGSGGGQGADGTGQDSDGAEPDEPDDTGSGSATPDETGAPDDSGTDGNDGSDSGTSPDEPDPSPSGTPPAS